MGSGAELLLELVLLVTVSCWQWLVFAVSQLENGMKS